MVYPKSMVLVVLVLFTCIHGNYGICTKIILFLIGPFLIFFGMETDKITHTLNDGERVASIYADTFFNDEYCDYKNTKYEESEITENEPSINEDNEWRSPSDLLIGILDLIPPFTSKITRGKTHQGILAIGDDLLRRERERFERYLNKLLYENEVAWSHIIEHEKATVAKKVKGIYKGILADKTKIFLDEINTFYENTLQELENYMRQEVTSILASTHANIVSDLNEEIKRKLEYEKKILVSALQKRYDSEIKKVTHYYKLILNYEQYRNNKLVNQALYQRNDAVRAFYNQIQADTFSSTMYMMCTERKRCRIKQFILNSYQSAEIAEKLEKIKERRKILDTFKKREKHIPDINKEWEDKIKKILQLFLKFIGFALKLLPEQSTFLLDLEKMFVLQLNEMQKTPSKTSSILIDEEVSNTYKFEPVKKEETHIPICKEPIVIVGDTSDIIPTPHGSRETLDLNVPLPMIRVQRKFIYAKCDKFKEVRALLEAQRCKCMDAPPSPPESPKSIPVTAKCSSPTIESESSNESLMMDDIEILKHCPGKSCQDYSQKYHFPHINDYLDYSEEKYERVKVIIGKPPPKDVAPELIDPQRIVRQELPFSVTREKYHHIGTQYSSQEDLQDLSNLACPCMEEATAKIRMQQTTAKEPTSKVIDQIMKKRKTELLRVINENPNLLKMFTDESFDFIYTIK